MVGRFLCTGVSFHPRIRTMRDTRNRKRISAGSSNSKGEKCLGHFASVGYLEKTSIRRTIPLVGVGEHLGQPFRPFNCKGFKFPVNGMERDPSWWEKRRENQNRGEFLFTFVFSTTRGNASVSKKFLTKKEKKKKKDTRLDEKKIRQRPIPRKK